MCAVTSLEMRNLLVSTGIPQGADSLTRHIGPLPNIRAALNKLTTITALEAQQARNSIQWRLSPRGLVVETFRDGNFDLTLTDISGRVVHDARGS